MSGTSWLIDSKRIATKIKNASKSVDPSRVKWISNPTKACPRCNHVIDNSDVVQEWPGLPQGVKFDPSDQELIWHLLAKVGKGDVKPHPFINEFIPTVDEDEGICYSHPQKLPGVKQDGSVAHFFHRTFRAYNTGTRKRRKIQQNSDDEHMGGQGGDVRWHKTGKTKAVVIDGVHIGCKKIMVLYSSIKKGEKPEKTNWVMHQYHLGTREDEKDGEYVVSKVFYQQQQLKPCDNSKSEGHDLLPVTTVEALDGEASAAALETQAEPAVAVDHVAAPSSATCPEPYVYDEQQQPAQVQVDNEIANCECSAAQDLEQEKLDGECNDNHLTTEEDSKWWEGESQFLLDSQQLAEGIALCDELLQSQSSCGGGTDETKRIKPCLSSEYGRIGGVEDLKRDLEECQTLGLNHLAVSGHQHLTTDIELLDTPPDMRLSQLEFGSQDSFLV